MLILLRGAVDADAVCVCNPRRRRKKRVHRSQRVPESCFEFNQPANYLRLAYPSRRIASSVAKRQQTDTELCERRDVDTEHALPESNYNFVYSGIDAVTRTRLLLEDASSCSGRQPVSCGVDAESRRRATVSRSGRTLSGPVMAMLPDRGKRNEGASNNESSDGLYCRCGTRSLRQS